MFSLPDLPYDYDALEPYIDSETMELHHTKHHQGYVDKLNTALAGNKDLLEMPIEKLLENLDKVPEGIKQAVINNGGGHANHSFFWKIMRPVKTGDEIESKPEEELLTQINNAFGSFEEFKNKFSEKALGVFGSGWAFLIRTSEGKLLLKRHSFQNSPLMRGNTPILGIDVWEHAYYLKYKNRRDEYIKNWWNVVNWEEVSNRYLVPQ